MKMFPRLCLLLAAALVVAMPLMAETGDAELAELTTPTASLDEAAFAPPSIDELFDEDRVDFGMSNEAKGGAQECIVGWPSCGCYYSAGECQTNCYLVGGGGARCDVKYYYNNQNGKKVGGLKATNVYFADIYSITSCVNTC